MFHFIFLFEFHFILGNTVVMISCVLVEHQGLIVVVVWSGLTEWYLYLDDWITGWFGRTPPARHVVSLGPAWFFTRQWRKSPHARVRSTCACMHHACPDKEPVISYWSICSSIWFLFCHVYTSQIWTRATRSVSCTSRINPVRAFCFGLGNRTTPPRIHCASLAS